MTSRNQRKDAFVIHRDLDTRMYPVPAVSECEVPKVVCKSVRRLTSQYGIDLTVEYRNLIAYERLVTEVLTRKLGPRLAEELLPMVMQKAGTLTGSDDPIRYGLLVTLDYRTDINDVTLCQSHTLEARLWKVILPGEAEEDAE